MTTSEADVILEEILVTSRTLVDLGDSSTEASNLCQELRMRRRALLDRLRVVRESEQGR